MYACTQYVAFMSTHEEILLSLGCRRLHAVIAIGIIVAAVPLCLPSFMLLKFVGVQLLLVA